MSATSCLSKDLRYRMFLATAAHNQTRIFKHLVENDRRLDPKAARLHYSSFLGILPLAAHKGHDAIVQLSVNEIRPYFKDDRGDFVQFAVMRDICQGWIKATYTLLRIWRDEGRVNKYWDTTAVLYLSYDIKQWVDLGNWEGVQMMIESAPEIMKNCSSYVLVAAYNSAEMNGHLATLQMMEEKGIWPKPGIGLNKPLDL
jgi:hypothetical protein